MTAQTVAEIGDAFLAVLLFCFGAVVAGVAGPLRQGGLVTIGAGVQTIIFLSVVHGEGVRAIVRGRTPGSGGVTF